MEGRHDVVVNIPRSDTILHTVYPQYMACVSLRQFWIRSALYSTCDGLDGHPQPQFALLRLKSTLYYKLHSNCQPVSDGIWTLSIDNPRSIMFTNAVRIAPAARLVKYGQPRSATMAIGLMCGHPLHCCIRPNVWIRIGFKSSIQV